MRPKTVFICLLTVLSMFIVSCGKPNSKEVLARVDNKYTITLGEFNDRISNLPERYQEVAKKNKEGFLDELIIDTLLQNEALSKKLDKDKDVQQMFEEAKKKIIVSRLLDDEVDKKITVTEEEIKSYYEGNQERFKTPEVLRASHILVKTKKEAEDVRAELVKGANFEELARKRSIDPTAKTGGDIGYFTEGQLVPEIEEISFTMQVGDVSEVVQTDFGYHVIKLTERRESRIKDLEQSHDAIAQAIKRVKKQKLFNEFVEGLKEKSKIIINNKLLSVISEEEQN